MNAKKKKLTTVAVAGLLVAGLAGGGAFTTLHTSITGNQFNAEVPAQDAPGPEGALLEITGQALTHTFDVTRFNDSVDGTWTLTNRGTQPAPFDGTLNPVGELSQSLADNLQVQYGTGTAPNITWHDAGTLSAPVSYADALNLTDPTLAGGTNQTIPVRVILADPTALEGDEGENLQVNATFTVDYIDPGAPASQD